MGKITEIVLKEVRLTVPGKWMFEATRSGLTLTNLGESDASIDISEEECIKYGINKKIVDLLGLKVTH